MSYVKYTGQGRIFQNNFLELFTKTNPVLHVLTYGSLILLCLLINPYSLVESLIYILGGFVVWTLKEYLIHRYLFHIRLPRMQYMIHGVHHEYPKDKQRLLMPPVPGIMIFILFLSFWYLVLNDYAFVFMIGILLGYLFYTFMHFVIHAYKPVKGFKFFWTHHLKHHNPRFENKAFGVSSPFWDWVFRTLPNESNS